MTPEQVEFVFDSYKLLERKLEDFLGILPLSVENEMAWSPNLVSLFVEAGNLLDSLSRTILGGGKGLDVDDFQKKLFDPMTLLDSRVVIYTYPLRSCRPFENYRSNDGWWNVYNKLKHNRFDHFEKANLVNVLNALGALFLLLTRYEDKEFSLALNRRQWMSNGVVPEFVHYERIHSPHSFWCDSSLFGVGANNSFIPDVLSDINPIFGSPKFRRYFGRLNSTTIEFNDK
jgi:hypothetical protein